MSLLDAVQTARGSSSVSPTSKPTSSGTSSLLDAVQVARGGASVTPTPTASPKPVGTVSIAKPQNESLLSKIGGYVASNLNSIIAKIPSNTQDKVKMATNIASKIVTEQPQIKTLVKVARKPVVKKYAEDTVALGIDAIKKGVDTIKGAGQLTAPYQIYRAAIGNPVKPQEFAKSVVEFGLDIIGLQWRLNPLAPVVGAKMSQEKQLRQMAQNGKLKWDDVLKLAVGGVAGPIGRAAAGASIVGSESLVEGVNTQPGVGETFTDNVKLAQAIDIIFLGTMFVAPIAEAKVADLNVKASNFLDRIKPLDISPNATMKEVTEAVRSKMKLHPDAFTNDPTPSGMKARTEITDALNAFKEAGFIDKKYAQAFDFFAKKLGIEIPPLATETKIEPKQITDGKAPEVKPLKLEGIDKNTSAKMKELNIADANNPIAEGKVRVYQAISKGNTTDYVFKDPELLAKYKNNVTAPEEEFKYIDVNPDQVHAVEGKPNVFKIDSSVAEGRLGDVGKQYDIVKKIRNNEIDPSGYKATNQTAIATGKIIDKDIFPDAKSIRTATEADAKEFGGIYGGRARVITLADGSRIITDATVFRNKIILDEFAVAPKDQNKGIGTKYISELKKIADELGYEIDVARITSSADSWWRKHLDPTGTSEYRTTRSYKPNVAQPPVPPSTGGEITGIVKDYPDPVQNPLYDEMRKAQEIMMKKIDEVGKKGYKTDADIPKKDLAILNQLKAEWQSKVRDWEVAYKKPNVAQPPVSDATAAPHLLKNKESVKLETQKNDGWCGPTALQYALKEQGLDASQEELAKGMGATISQGADPRQITAEAKKQGLQAETIQGEDAQKTLATLDQALSEGKSVILDFLDGKDLQNDGHYVLYQGRENGNITVMDPQTGKPRTIDEQKFIDQWKDTTIKGNLFKRWATILDKKPQILGGKPEQPKKIVGRSKYATTGIREVLSSAESPQDSVNKLDAFVKDFVKGADQSNMADLRAGLVKEIDSLVGGTGNYKRDYAVRVAMRDDIEVGGLVRALEKHISDIDATIRDYPEKNVSPADDIVGSETSITIPAEVNQAGQTPVGQGKLRESTAYAKIKSRIAEEAQLDVKYNKVNLNADIEKAVQFLDENPKAAVRVALGLEKAPEGQLERNITIATAEKALADGDIALWNQIESSGSLRQTRRGQEIVADRGRFNDNSPHTFMKELISRRLDKLGYSFQQAIKDAGKKVGSLKESAIAKIDERTAKLREKLKKDQGKIKLAQDIIDLLRC